MSYDASLLITGFCSLAAAEAAVEAARPALMGPTSVSVLGTHHPLDATTAACHSLTAYCDADGHVLVEASTLLRWKLDPHAHDALRAFVAACAAQFPGHDLHWTEDDTASRVRFNDARFAGELSRGTIQPLPR